jgi:hypothetical protein
LSTSSGSSKLDSGGSALGLKGKGKSKQ